MERLKEEMKKFEEAQKGGEVHAKFQREDDGINVECSVRATGGELRALMTSLALKICATEGVDAVELFAELTVATMLQQRGEDNE